MAIKRYSNKEPLVFIWVIVPYLIFMNLLIFGSCVHHSWSVFGTTFLISAVYFFIIYAIFGSVAVLIKNTYPDAGDLFRRILVMLPVFYLMNALAIPGVFAFYNFTGWSHCATRPEMTGWTILYACIMSTVITFINEGMANWEKWKNSLSKAEKLRNAYQKSKVLGLKGQINPHFLFNCFNTLSGLIQEDADRADSFLNEMIRVHRYLLHNDDAFLVCVADELKYADAYLNLAKARFGEAISVDIEVNPDVMNRQVPPLTMQVVLENIIYTNALNKKDPVSIRIASVNQDELIIRHSLHEKIIVRDLNMEEGIENLSVRYGLLNAEVNIQENNGFREIRLPLFKEQEAAT